MQIWDVELMIREAGLKPVAVIDEFTECTVGWSFETTALILSEWIDERYLELLDDLSPRAVVTIAWREGYWEVTTGDEPLRNIIEEHRVDELMGETWSQLHDTWTLSGRAAGR